MAKLYADTTGRVLRFASTDAEDARYPAPTGSANVLAFDPATNPALVAALRGQTAGVRSDEVTYDGTTVALAGTPYTVQAPGAAFSDLSTLRTIVAAWEAGTAPTAAQVLVLVRVLLRDLGHMA